VTVFLSRYFGRRGGPFLSDHHKNIKKTLARVWLLCYYVFMKVRNKTKYVYGMISIPDKARKERQQKIVIGKGYIWGRFVLDAIDEKIARDLQPVDNGKGAA
jgi:hypothetical protein